MERYSRTIIAMAVLVLAVSSNVSAAPSATFNVTVTITAEASVSVAGGPVNFGTMGLGQSAVSTAAIVVENDGSGSNQTYSLALVEPSSWTSTTGDPGMNTYRLSAAFDSDGTLTWDPAKHALTTSAVASSDTKFAGDQTGALVSYNEVRNLYLKLETPSKTSSPGAKTIQVIITATVQ